MYFHGGDSSIVQEGLNAKATNNRSEFSRSRKSDMSCPYMNATSDIHNDHDAVSSTNSTEESTASNVGPESTTQKDKPKEPLNYTTYLCIEKILDALKCLSHVDPSDENSPHVHDEHFFILIHQGNDSKTSNPNNI